MGAGLAILCFFLSGAAALVFEQVWARTLSVVFGTSALALATVLASLMGGLALGSAVGGRVADKLRRPLRAYAAVEAGIALAGLAIPHVLGARETLARLGGDSFAVASLARFVVAGAVLLVPATLMGASLPLLARHVVRRESDARRSGARLGWLYGANTAGAVVGALAAGFGLLPLLGVAATNRVAVGTDLAIAAFVWLLARRPERAPDEAAEMLAALDDTPRVEISPAARRAVIVAYAVSGAAAMAHEVLWTRALAVVIGSSVYSFTIILTAFLAGLAAGALAFARVAARTPRPVEWLAAAGLAAALAAALTTATLDRLPGVFLGMLQGSSYQADTVLMLHFVVATLAIFPPAFMMGAFFPLTMQCLCGRAERVGRDTGRAYAWNTVGAIAGSFAGGFLLLRWLGLRGGLLVAGGAYLLVAAGLVLFTDAPRRRRATAAAAVLALLAAGAWAPPRWDLVHLTVGYFRTSLAREYLTEPYERPALLFYEDGLSSTVTVERWGKDLFALKNNGKVDASSRDDMPTQIMVGALPVLLHRDLGKRPLRVLLVGFASGATAGAILQANVGRLDVVELEEAMLRASRFFEHVNHRPLADPRLGMHIDDGRNFLLRTRDKYDVIVNEPSNPWIAGVASLFTVEYFRLARARLAPGGIFCSWAQLYEMSPTRIKSVYRAFAEVFERPYVFAAEDLSSDTFLVGGKEEIPLDLPWLRRAFEDSRFRAELLRAGVRSPHDLPAMLLLAPGEMRAFTAGAVANTDDNALVEFGAPRDLYAHKRHDSYVSRVYGRHWGYGRIDGLLRGWDEGDAARNFGDLAAALVRHGKRREAAAYAERAGAAGDEARALIQLVADREPADPEQPLPDDLEPPHPPPGLGPDDERRFAVDYTAVERHIGARRFATAYETLDAWPDEWIDAAGPDFQLEWGFLLYKAMEFRTAVRVLAPLVDDAAWLARRPVALYYLGRAHYGNADYAKGVDMLVRWRDVRDARPVAASTPSH